MKKNKITFIFNHAAYLVSHRIELIETLIKNGWSVQILFGKAGSKIMEKKAIKILNKKKIKFSKNSFDTSGFGISNIIGLFQLYVKVLMFNPRVIHLVSPKAIILGGIISLISRVKLTIIAVTGVGTIFLSDNKKISSIIKNFYLFILKIILKIKNKKLIFQNKSDLKDFKKYFGISLKVTVLIEGSGINLKKITSKKKQNRKKNIILPARLIKEKGIYEFIEAARVLKKKHKKWNFVLVGTCDYNNPSSVNEEYIKQKAREGIIVWHGYVSNMQKVYQSSSIVCLPSYREGFPKCLIEAAAYGLPVITSDVPGCRDAIINNKTGILVKAKNSTSLINGLEKLIKNSKKRELFGGRGYYIAKKKFDINQVIKKTINLYETK